MGKRRNRKKYRYHINRKKLWLKSKQLPSLDCLQLKNAWAKTKSVATNFARMGLVSDINKTMRIPNTKTSLRPFDFVNKIERRENYQSKWKAPKLFVANALEAEASLKPERSWSFSGPLRMFCTYMLDKYGDDYKAMARDPKNYYQETPKKIKKQVLLFKSLPEVYTPYLEEKAKKQLQQDTEETLGTEEMHESKTTEIIQESKASEEVHGTQATEEIQKTQEEKFLEQDKS